MSHVDEPLRPARRLAHRVAGVAVLLALLLAAVVGARWAQSLWWPPVIPSGSGSN